MRRMDVTPDSIERALPANGLFREPGIPWRVSPYPLPLTKAELRQLEGLGHILACFQDAAHDLYLRSLAGEEAPWLAPLLESGKPAWLINAQRQIKSTKAASIIRPDLLRCPSGFTLTELDSVPGGMGITLFLSRLYAAAGFPILGGAEGIAEGFRKAHPTGATIAVSQESADYKPEMEYLAEALGSGYSCTQAENLPHTLPAGSCLYRFFELFDTESIPAARELLEASARDEFRISPPAIEHQEEKLWLALLHTPGLQAYWQRSMRAAHLNRLQETVPHGWVVDPSPLPAQAALPWLNLNSWEQIAALSQKNRRLVLKISGFDPTAWGARSVVIGHDEAAESWRHALQHALEQFPRKPWIMQEFREASIIEHPYFAPDGSIRLMQGRVRLCPYYFRNARDGHTTLGGCLATITPKDKKKIHGMPDAILVPCQTP